MPICHGSTLPHPAYSIISRLVAGLIAEDPAGFAFRVFFLACVIVAGAYGAATVNRRILAIQALPAVTALVFVLLAR